MKQNGHNASSSIIAYYLDALCTNQWSHRVIDASDCPTAEGKGGGVALTSSHPECTLSLNMQGLNDPQGLNYTYEEYEDILFICEWYQACDHSCRFLSCLSQLNTLHYYSRSVRAHDRLESNKARGKQGSNSLQLLEHFFKYPRPIYVYLFKTVLLSCLLL